MLKSTDSPALPPSLKIWSWNEAGDWYFMALVFWPATLLLAYFTLSQPPKQGEVDSRDLLRIVIPVGVVLSLLYAIYIARTVTLWIEIGVPLRYGSLLRTQAIPLGMVQRMWIEDGSSRHPIGLIADALQKDVLTLVIEINHYHTLTTRVHRKYYPALLEIVSLLPQFGSHPMYDDDPKEDVGEEMDEDEMDTDDEYSD
jgi:hypothetical protein